MNSDCVHQAWVACVVCAVMLRVLCVRGLSCGGTSEQKINISAQNFHVKNESAEIFFRTDEQTHANCLMRVYECA